MNALIRCNAIQVRIHWLLHLLELESYNSLINFNKLDSVLDNMEENNLNPGFELMGNPGGVFSDFSNKSERDLWFKVISQLVQRYSERLVFVCQLEFQNENNYALLFHQ